MQKTRPMKTYETLSQATTDLQQRGFKLDFTQKGEFLQCVQNPDLKLHPDDFEIVEVYRFEGKSNPSDMSVIYVLESSDGERGVLIDAYGAYSGGYSSDMIRKLDIRANT